MLDKFDYGYMCGILILAINTRFDFDWWLQVLIGIVIYTIGRIIARTSKD